MRKQLDRLIELGKEYRDYGVENHFAQSHNILRQRTYEDEIGKQIKVYFSDNYKCCAVYFWDVEIHYYGDMIQVPLNVTEKHLEEVYDDAKQFLEEYKADKEGVYAEAWRKSLTSRKKQLEEELSKLNDVLCV